MRRKRKTNAHDHDVDDGRDAGDDGGLFNDEEEDHAKASGFTINEAYAKRFEHNKRREEMHRLQEKHPEVAARLVGDGDADEEDEESTSVDESGDDLIDPREDEELLKTLVKIKNKDPSIYDATAKFYSESTSSVGEQDGAPRPKRKKRDRKQTLRTLQAERALAEGAEGLAQSSSDDEDGYGNGGRGSVVTYKEEQEKLRRDFLDAGTNTSDDGSDDDGGMDGLMHVKGKHSRGTADGNSSSDDSASDGDDSAHRKQTQNLLDDYFGNEKEMKDSDKAFLKNFIANEGWRSKDGDGDYYDEGHGYGRAHNQFDVSDGEDGAHLEQAEEFEQHYNFRFEEPNAAKIETYPRTIESSVRKIESKRKRQRERKAERIVQARQEDAEEVKRLKNLKKAAIQEKLDQIKAVAGSDVNINALALLEEDYDPDKLDAQLAKMFDDEYYEGEDADIDAKATGNKMLDNLLADEPDTIDEESRSLLERGSRKNLKDDETIQKTVEEVQRDMNEYFKLDFEDKIGDLKCRFKYKNVEKNNFGLETSSILGTSDKELNGFVSLKKIAPYAAEWRLLRKQKKVGVKWTKKDKKWEAELEWKGDKKSKDKASSSSKGHKHRSGKGDKDGDGTGERDKQFSRLDSFVPPKLGKLSKKDKGPSEKRSQMSDPGQHEPRVFYNKGEKKRMKRAERRSRKHSQAK